MEEELPRIPARLPLLCTPIDGETLSGFVIRLMERNQLGNLDHVRPAFGRRLPHDFSSAADLRDLAALSGVTETRLRAMSVEHIPDDHFLRPGTISVGGLRSARHLAWGPLRRFCPGCLAESAHHRLQWDFLAIQYCASHGNALAWACPECSAETSWRDSSIARCKCGFDLRRTQPARTPAIAVPLVAMLDTLFRGGPNVVVPKLTGVAFADMVNLLEDFGRCGYGNYLAPNPRDIGTSHTLVVGLILLEFDHQSTATYLEEYTRRDPYRRRRAAQVWAIVLRLEWLGQPWTMSLARSIRQAIGVEIGPDTRLTSCAQPPPAVPAKWSHQNPQLELFPWEYQHARVPADPQAWTSGSKDRVKTIGGCDTEDQPELWSGRLSDEGPEPAIG